MVCVFIVICVGCLVVDVCGVEGVDSVGGRVIYVLKVGTSRYLPCDGLFVSWKYGILRDYTNNDRLCLRLSFKSRFSQDSFGKG